MNKQEQEHKMIATSAAASLRANVDTLVRLGYNVWVQTPDGDRAYVSIKKVSEL